MARIGRLLGRRPMDVDVTHADARRLIVERQARQEARLRALDLQAELPERRRPR